MTRRLMAAGCFAIALGAQAQSAPPLPAIDLGQTNILDGEAGPGAVLEGIGFGSISDRLVDADGNTVPGRNHQRIGGLILHPVWISSASAIGAHPGVEFLVPFTRVDNDFAAGGSGFASGFSDITIAPFLQWFSSPRTGSLSVRLAMQFVVPSGRHRAQDAVNVGQGAMQWSPYLSTTWRFAESWEFSSRVIYDRTNSSSLEQPDGERIRVRPGDLVALNATVSYGWSPALRVGVAGYALQQLGAARVDGSRVGGRERVFALGPAVQWTFGKNIVRVAAFGEFGARNRPEGVSFNARLAHLF